MKKKILPVFAAALLLAVGIRIWYVNRDLEKPRVETYQMGEEVQLGDNIRYYSNEHMQGYTITANRAQILSYEEFLQKYDYVEDEDYPLFAPGDMTFPEMVYDVEVTVRNTNTEETDGYIDFTFYSLYGLDYYMQTSDPLYVIANPQLKDGMMGFKLRPGTEMVFHLPFRFAPSSKDRPLSVKKVKNDDVYLVLTFLPCRQQILIRETEN